MANLFEIDKQVCGIATLYGVPVAVIMNRATAQFYYSLVEYMNRATEQFHGSCAKKGYKFISGMRFEKQLITIDSDNMAIIEGKMDYISYLNRYWCNAVIRQHINEMGTMDSFPANVNDLIYQIKHAVSVYYNDVVEDVINGVSIATDNLAAIKKEVNDVFRAVWNTSTVLVSMQGSPIFYPIHKLIGKKVPNILRRCGIKALVYPYCDIPESTLALKIANRTAVLTRGTFPAVGMKGLMHLANRMSGLENSVTDKISSTTEPLQINTRAPGVDFKYKIYSLPKQANPIQPIEDDTKNPSNQNLANQRRQMEQEAIE